VRIPVIVMGELEGLSRTRDPEASSPEHAAIVREASRTALAWIRDKQPNVKCVTTKGKAALCFYGRKVLGIRIRRIRMFFGLPDPSVSITQRYGSGSGSISQRYESGSATKCHVSPAVDFIYKKK
jgi:hypothetical protein